MIGTSAAARRPAHRPRFTATGVGTILLSAWCHPVTAQTIGCQPAGDRGHRTFGCFITARQRLVSLPDDTTWYWHIDGYSGRAAAEADRGPRGTVVSSPGRLWLFTLADSSWHPTAGDHIATIGPLPQFEADTYTATYLESVFQPGMHSAVHRHPGVEAWYTLEGAQCLETPEETVVQSAGGPGIMVAAGQPMRQTGMDSGTWRSLGLILHDASRPRSTLAPDWTPAGLCADSASTLESP